MNNKQILRKQIIAKMQKISLENQKRWSNEIFQRIIDLPCIKQAQTIGFYYAMAQEVSTKTMIAYLLKQNKQICLPKIDNNNQMKMLQIKSLDFPSHQKQCFIEPSDENKQCFKEKIDCMIIPGLAFDQKNNRLGRGQGHYDKYLKKFTGKTVMLAFEMQKNVDLPTNLWDVPMAIIVTEQSIYKV